MAHWQTMQKTSKATTSRISKRRSRLCSRKMAWQGLGMEWISRTSSRLLTRQGWSFQKRIKNRLRLTKRLRFMWLSRIFRSWQSVYMSSTPKPITRRTSDLLIRASIWTVSKQVSSLSTSTTTHRTACIVRLSSSHLSWAELACSSLSSWVTVYQQGQSWRKAVCPSFTDRLSRVIYASSSIRTDESAKETRE